jgi:hypothetical protein
MMLLALKTLALWSVASVVVGPLLMAYATRARRYEKRRLSL